MPVDLGLRSRLLVGEAFAIEWVPRIPTSWVKVDFSGSLVCCEDPEAEEGGGVLSECYLCTLYDRIQ